jgi:DNA end-binding protein Ku
MSAFCRVRRGGEYESKTVHFREVHLADEAKVEHRRFCSAEDREVPYEEVVKGFEVNEGEYVILDKDEIAAAAGDRGHVIEIERFVETGAIDPVFYEKTYFLGAGKDGGDAHRLLHDALGKTDRTGLGRFSFHNREYLAAIRPLDGVLGLHTMRFADELVPAPSSISTSRGGDRASARSRWPASSSRRCTRTSTRASARTSTARRCST